MSKTLRLKVENNRDQHFTMFADEPMRVEVLVVNGKVVAYGYRGVEIDQEQEPDLIYDGNIGFLNKDIVA